jgi:mRNA-degrading endonuclease toxin of MazEF toxin-antitoxin module
VDQVRSVDKRRVVRLVGRVADDEVAAIERGLMLFLGMLT